MAGPRISRAAMEFLIMWGTWHRDQATHLPGQSSSNLPVPVGDGAKRGWIERSRDRETCTPHSCFLSLSLSFFPSFFHAQITRMRSLRAPVSGGHQSRIAMSLSMLSSHAGFQRTTDRLNTVPRNEGKRIATSYVMISRFPRRS
jgi:hypothetical protein